MINHLRAEIELCSFGSPFHFMAPPWASDRAVSKRKTDSYISYGFKPTYPRDADTANTLFLLVYSAAQEEGFVLEFSKSFRIKFNVMICKILHRLNPNGTRGR